MLEKLRIYYRLTKPGIIYGNIITTAAGFFLASKGHINILLLLAVMLGTSFIIASACVFNNYIDRNIDKKMQRTQKRALAQGIISIKAALLYATLLGLLGVLLLGKYTNFLTVWVGLIGFVDYVILYGIGKRRSTLGTIIGSISGSMPIVAGYTAVTNRFDMGALLLFLILTAWQMPHFYAIAIYRLKDYAAAGLPVLPVKNGIFVTKIHMFFYVVMFVITIALLSFLGFVGLTYLVVMAMLGLFWLWINIQGFFTHDDTKWARKMFFFSLILILAISLVIPIDVIIQHGIHITWY